jgi:putative membrane-bound dehydrogenase-like protein
MVTVGAALALMAGWWTQTGAGHKTAQPTAKVASPLTPQQAQKEFRLTAGLRIELVASEPQLESPVAMQFDEDGRLWVVEMPDYPNGPAKGEKPRGRIKILEDKDGDGFYETATVFADNLLFANGLLRWKDGVIVTAAPHIVWLRDTKGTGKCDKSEVLYEGFAAQNPQLRVSHPVLGLDGWIYCANGLRGGKVKSAGDPKAKIVDLSGRDFRFDPLSGKYEAISGLGQFGNCFDDWGNRFVCDNRHHLRHVVMPHWALERNPYLVATEVHQDISVLDLEPGPLSSGGKVYPISNNWTTSNLHAARFTAACGVHIYRGKLLPKEFQGAAFTCEPTGNLVHQEILTPRGATFTSKPAKEGVEFLASPDDWFRPVFLSGGPDGALYVVDMYRAVIEHPEFMPPELKKRPDLTLGKDKGRIWRIVPEGHKTKALRPNLSKATTAELVKLLENEDAWWRTTAQRLLLERGSKESALPLWEAFERHSPGKVGGVLAAVQTAWLLAKLDPAKSEACIGSLLKSPDKREKLQGLLLLRELPEPWPKSAMPLLAECAKQSDASLRFHAALVGGPHWKEDLAPLVHVVRNGADDPWTRLGVVAAIPDHAGDLLIHLHRKQFDELIRGWSPWAEDLAKVVGVRQNPEEVAKVLGAFDPGKTKRLLHLTVLVNMAEGMSRRGGRFMAFLDKLGPEHQALVKSTRACINVYCDDAGDAINRPECLLAVRLLAHAPWSTAKPVVTELFPRGQDKLRLAMVRSLAVREEPEIATILLQGWKQYTPALRREVTEALLRQPDRIKLLLKEIEAGKVKAGDIDAPRARQLLNHKNAAIRDLAKKLLQDSQPAERKEVLTKYQPALKLKGDPQKGKTIFQKNCATCHKVAGLGVDVGPDISDTRTKTPEGLLTDILNPNAAIDNNYVNYVITLKNGRTVTGMIASETATGLTLRRAEDQSESILRTDIDEIQSTGQSLMPEGLEKGITVEEMADLLNFLKNWRYLDGAVPK